MEEATIFRHAFSRHNLATIELKNGRAKSAVKHLIIAANLEFVDTMKGLRSCMQVQGGLMSQEDVTAALRAHQTAVVATKSPQREEAEARPMNLCETSNTMRDRLLKTS